MGSANAARRCAPRGSHAEIRVEAFGHSYAHVASRTAIYTGCAEFNSSRAHHALAAALTAQSRGTNARSMRERVDHGYAWVRLAAAVGLSTIGGVGMWSVVVALPTVQAEFGS